MRLEGVLFGTAVAISLFMMQKNIEKAVHFHFNRMVRFMRGWRKWGLTEQIVSFRFHRKPARKLVGGRKLLAKARKQIRA